MERRTLIRAILSGVITVYIAVMLPLTNRAERDDTFEGIEINIDDPEGRGFLTDEDVNDELGNIVGQLDTLRRGNFNSLECERILTGINRVEKARCLILNNGILRIDIDPIDPVARFFEPDGSVYVNAAGKRVKAKAAYHVDVPVVTTTHRADSAMVHDLLPLLRAIKKDPANNVLISSLRIDRRGDIIIIPNVLGHVINFGDTTLIDNKFARLRAFYRNVMPVRGWNAYDTISVKWAGRIVATKRDKNVASLRPDEDFFEIILDVDNDETMMTEGMVNTATR